MTTLRSDPALQVYGIANCSTVKKARQWLTHQGQDYQFHDFKKAAPQAAETSPRWQQAVGWEELLNRQGANVAQARCCHPGQHHRRGPVLPLFCSNSPAPSNALSVQWPSGTITIGFNAEDWQHLLTHAG